MTPEEINEINCQVAKWLDGDAAKTCTKCLCNRFITPCTYDCPEYKPTNFYTSDAYAYTLLIAMVKKKYWYELISHHDDTHTCSIGRWIKDKEDIKYREYICIAERQRQISTAICNALIQVIRKEKEQ